MITQKQSNDWTVDFNFDIPSEYRRTFHLQDGDCRLLLSVSGRTITFRGSGHYERSHLSAHMDWIEDCMNSVREEFGQ